MLLRLHAELVWLRAVRWWLRLPLWLLYVSCVVVWGALASLSVVLDRPISALFAIAVLSGYAVWSVRKWGE